MDNKGAVYRALVLDANERTGEIVVAIPNLTGADNRVTLTALNRHAVDGVWKVPTIGSVALVGSDDANGSTLFLIPTFTYDNDVRANNFYGDFDGPVVLFAVNSTASTIPAYTAVCGQASGGTMVIAKSNANDSSKPVLGITVEDIAPNASGKVAVGGVLDGPNTGSLAANINVFGGTSGDIVATPVGLSYPQVIAKVLRVGNPGSLLVTIKDVPTSFPTNGSWTGVFNGTVYATAGNIGGASAGWVIDSNRLESRGSTQKIVLDGQNGEMYIGTYGTGIYNSASTPYYVNQSGYFSLGNKLTFNPTTSTLDINGRVTADAGTIGGWTIDATKLSAGTGASAVALASSGGYSIYAGASSPGAATFKVSDTGYLTASGVDLSGKLVATSGSIGGWSITAGSISSSGATPIVLNSAGKITVGNTNWGNTANGFYVDNTGKFGLGSKLTWDTTNLIIDGTVTAASGTIGGWSINNTQLYAGSGSNFIAMSSDNAIEYRTWAGHPTAASAPFFITKGGGLYASNASIAGAISASSGTIGGFSIGATALTSGTGSSTVGVQSSGTYPFYAGSSNASFNGSPYSVRYDGYVTASSISVLNFYNTGGSPGIIQGQFSIDGGKLVMGRQLPTAGSPSGNPNWSGIYQNATIGTTNSSAWDNYWLSTGEFHAGSPTSFIDFSPSASVFTVKGTIVSTAGSIGGWVLGANTLTSGSGASAVGVGSSGGYPFWAGSATPSTAPFRVTNTGAMVATSGSIGGFSLGSTTISAGTPLSYGAGTQVPNVFGLAGNASPHYIYAGQQNYLKLTGGSTSYAYAADNVTQRITGDIEFIVRAAADDWTAGPIQAMVAKTFFGSIGYSFFINASGAPEIQWSTGGSTGVTSASAPVAYPFGNKTTYWMRATLSVNTSGSTVANFYYAADSEARPSTWTTHATVSRSGTTSIWAGNNNWMMVGAAGAPGFASNQFTGRIYEVYVGTGGGVSVFEPVFTSQTVGTTSFTELGLSSTVTIASGASITASDYRFKVRQTGGVEANKFSIVNTYGEVTAQFGAINSEGFGSDTSTLGDLYYRYNNALLFPPSTGASWKNAGIGWGEADSTGKNYVVSLLGYNPTASSTSAPRMAAVSVYGTTSASADKNAIYIDSGKFQTNASNSAQAYMAMETQPPTPTRAYPYATLRVGSTNKFVSGSNINTYTGYFQSDQGLPAIFGYVYTQPTSSSVVTYSYGKFDMGPITQMEWGTNSGVQQRMSQGPWPLNPSTYYGLWNTDLAAGNGFVLIHSKSGASTYLGTHSSAGTITIQPAQQLTNGRIDVTSTTTTFWGRPQDISNRQFVRYSTATANPTVIESAATTSTTSSAGLVTVTFTDTFTSSPAVVVTPALSTGLDITAIVTVRSTTGFTVKFMQGGAALVSTSIGYSWIAVGQNTGL